MVACFDFVCTAKSEKLNSLIVLAKNLMGQNQIQLIDIHNEVKPCHNELAWFFCMKSPNLEK